MSRDELEKRLEFIKKMIDDTFFAFSLKGNAEEFRSELDTAAVSLEDALDIVDRDIAYQAYREQAA